MGKQQDWKQISRLRKIVKDKKTTIIKNPNGNIKGGVILTDETLKPYMEKLAALEAKTKTNREQMTTVEHIDDNTAEIIADAEQNKDEIKEYIAEQLAKLAPKSSHNKSINGRTLLRRKVGITTRPHLDKFSFASVTSQKNQLSLTKFAYTSVSTRTSIFTSTFMKMVQQDVKKE